MGFRIHAVVIGMKTTLNSLHIRTPGMTSGNILRFSNPCCEQMCRHLDCSAVYTAQSRFSVVFMGPRISEMTTGSKLKSQLH